LSLGTDGRSYGIPKGIEGLPDFLQTEIFHELRVQITFGLQFHVQGSALNTTAGLVEKNFFDRKFF
jgi:hypothetical protein